MTKKRKLNEEDLTLNLTLPDDVSLEPDEVEVSVVGAEEEGMEDMEGEDEVGLEDLEMDAEPSEMDDYEGEEDMGMEGEEEVVEADMMENEMYESNILEGLDDEDVVEIDESMLKKELARMNEEMSKDVLDDFGGAEVKGEPFVDVDDEDLNVLGENDEESKTEKVNETRKMRALKKQLVEYKKAVKQLRSQLAEMNLFSAKLLYTNKLLQNKTLSPKQKVRVVESLDEAKTLREAKLVYKSLTESLKKDLDTSKNISESKNQRRTLNSSSKVTRPGTPSQSLNEGNSITSRWAQLAGISGEE